MSRLVIVSNRLPSGDPRQAGGLVSALKPALEREGGLWFGWSGESGDPEAALRVQRDGRVEYHAMDLGDAEIRDYYEGFCNQTLWPLCHGFLDRACIEPAQLEAYRRVNARFAARLAPLLQPDDLIWVHDYHLIPLGQELRRHGRRGKIGYFHHIPVPSPADWRHIPEAGALAQSFRAYDLVGTQTERFAVQLHAIVGAALRVAAYPIGIEPDVWARRAAAHPANPFLERAGGRRVLLGVDRLDYSKGIPMRLEALARLLERRPTLVREVLAVQWAAPSRGAIPAYQQERAAVEAIVRRLEERFPGLPPPVWLEEAALPAEQVAAGYRDADLCLVTSLADGMNLVAKEFVAVQRPEAPGVLVLSTGCGAAEELTDAVLVDPQELASIGAGIEQALDMPAAERRRRWEALHARVTGYTVHTWRRQFLADLAAA